MWLSREAARGRRVLLTGASSGIGESLAVKLAHRGDRLVIVARRVDRLESLADRLHERHGVRPVVLPADLAVPGAAASVASQSIDVLGGIDVLINNAGGGAGGTVWRSADGAEARDAFEINYWSPLALIAGVLPGMLARGSGMIVNVTSMAQVMTWPLMGPYTATKAALASATEALRLELNSTAVRVLEVVPGPVDTAIQAESVLLPGFSQATRRAPLGDPEQLAERILRAMDRGRRRLVYPRALTGAYHLPGPTRRYIARSARRAPSVVDDRRVMRSGTFGDPDARAAREAWAQRLG